jgi:succinate dehydrogenase / fumarate reductase flavoprotein subunit
MAGTPTRSNVANVLVIGTGAAGLRAAIAAHQAGSEVVVVGKRRRDDAHTVLAAGGINAALGTSTPGLLAAALRRHAAGGLLPGRPAGGRAHGQGGAGGRAGAGRLGAPFARTPDGRLDQRFFGAHRWRRTCYAGDWTGRAILRTWPAKVAEAGPDRGRRPVRVPAAGLGRACFGALAFDLETGERTVFLADAVVLAAGGHTRIWRRSSSRRDENTGDGMYLALRAGCRLQDMELVQFHPTGMVAPEEAAGTLVTEAVRGEGGQLKNALGERFMARYDPERMELSARDRVALANYTEIAEGRGGPNGGVFLDITHLGKDAILEKLPRMYRQFLEYQMLDISQQPMEVAPTAHYSMGGVVVDPDTHATDVAGLYAAGEVTAGLHGANRLGGNSLAETVVFGRRAGEAAAGFSASRDLQLRDRRVVRPPTTSCPASSATAASSPAPCSGPCATPCGRPAGWSATRPACGRPGACGRAAGAGRRGGRPPDLRGLRRPGPRPDLRASLVTAEATLLGALARSESRGAHQRRDHPERRPP